MRFAGALPDAALEAWLAPLLLGTLAGALAAARFETALGCLALAALLAMRAGARRPGRATGMLFATGAALSLALNLYLNDGRPITGWPVLFGRVATWEGLAYGALLSLRVLGAGVALMGLAALWPGERGVDAIARMVRPLARIGVPVSEARLIAGLAWRFRPAVEAEGMRIAALQSLRAGRPPRGAGERLARAQACVVPTLIASLERAERVSLALEARHVRAREAPAGPPAVWPARLAGLAIAAVSLAWRAH